MTEIFPRKHEARLHPQCAQRTVPLCPTIAQVIHPPLSSLARTTKNSLFSIMSQNRSTTASSSKFQLIINDALKVYHKRTKNDLLLHPLATELQNSESPADILAVLQQQLHGLDQSQSGDDRWTKWLDPTINVLLTFSQTAGTVGLVCPTTSPYLRSAHSYLFGRRSHPRQSSSLESASSFQ